jgi:hypothetical protein
MHSFVLRHCAFLQNLSLGFVRNVVTQYVHICNRRGKAADKLLGRCCLKLLCFTAYLWNKFTKEWRMLFVRHEKTSSSCSVHTSSSLTIFPSDLQCSYRLQLFYKHFWAFMDVPHRFFIATRNCITARSLFYWQTHLEELQRRCHVLETFAISYVEWGKLKCVLL